MRPRKHLDAAVYALHSSSWRRR